MESVGQLIHRLMSELYTQQYSSATRRSAVFNPEVLPAEPITKPAPVITPRPDKNDPFNVPAPAVDPTPKGFF